MGSQSGCREGREAHHMSIPAQGDIVKDRFTILRGRGVNDCAVCGIFGAAAAAAAAAAGFVQSCKFGALAGGFGCNRGFRS